MKLIRTEDAVGHVLCHDMTQIIPGVCKDARFRMGHGGLCLGCEKCHYPVCALGNQP